MKQSNSRWAVNFTALVLAAGLLIGLLTGCPGTAGGTPSVPVDPAAILKTDGHGKITGCKCAKEELPSHLVIPAKIGDEEIKEIDSLAFQNCKGLTTISLPASLTKIGWGAFSDCTGLTSITLPANLTQIEGSAFSGCKGLTSLTIDSANTTYKTEGNILYSKDGTTLIFVAGGLTSANIPNTVTTIGQYAFYDCTGLTSITLPANLTQIAYGAFRGCTGLTSLTIDSANATYKTEGNILYNKAGTTLIFAAGGLTSANILNTVITIDGHAFNRCTGLRSITLPVNLTQIGEYAFRGCTGLTNITLPANLTEIGQYAFSGCTGLTSITLPANLTKIEHDAFSYCTRLTSITLPANLTQIGGYAFSGCTGLTSASFENTNGWKVYAYFDYSSTPTPISSSDLDNVATAAKYLREKTDKGGYCNKYWKKN